MPTQPIALQVRPAPHPEQQDPLTTFARVLQLRDLLQRGPMQAEQLKGEQLENQERSQKLAVGEKSMADQQLLNDIVRRRMAGGKSAASPGQPGAGAARVPMGNGMPDPLALGEAVDQLGVVQDLVQAGRYDMAAKWSGSLLDHHKAAAEAEKVAIENALAKAELGSHLLQGVKGQPGYDLALGMMKSAGLDVSKMDTAFNPDTVAQYVSAGLKASDALAKQKQARDDRYLNVENYGKTLTLVAPHLLQADSPERATATAEDLKTIPGIDGTAVDAALDAFKRGGRDAVLTLARTPDQIAKSDEEASREGVRERRATVGERREGRQASAAAEKRQREAGHFATLEVLRKKVRAGVGRGEPAKQIIERYLSDYGEKLSAAGVNTTAVRKLLLKEFGGAK